MQLPEDGMLLRIFVSETDKHKGKPLHEQIVLKARELQVARVAVLRGMMGFGADGHIQTDKILRLSLDLPIVIVLVDTEESLMRLMPFLDDAVDEGMVTIEQVKVIKYRQRR